jgi:hypothetical protein
MPSGVVLRPEGVISAASDALRTPKLDSTIHPA